MSGFEDEWAQCFEELDILFFVEEMILFNSFYTLITVSNRALGAG